MNDKIRKEVDRDEEIKRLNAALRALEDELKTKRFMLDVMMENHPDHIYFKDVAGRFTFINRATLDAIGSSSLAEILGKTDADLFTREYAAHIADEEAAIVRSGQSLVNLEEKETWLGGRETWVSTTKIPTYAEDGSINGIFGISRDISARKWAEFALIESEERFRSIFTFSPTGIAVTDQTGAIQFWNAAMERITGASAENALGMPLWDVLETSAVKDPNGGGTDLFPRQLFLDLVSGHAPKTQAGLPELTFPDVIGSAEMFSFSTGGGERLACFITDISRRKHIEKDLHQQMDEMHILSLIAGVFINCMTVEDIVRYVGPILKHLSSATYLNIFLYNPLTHHTELKFSSGMEHRMVEIRNTLGFNPLQQGFKIENGPDKLIEIYNPSAIQYQSDGVFALFSGIVPQFTCQQLELILDISSIYTGGFAWPNTFCGGIIFGYSGGQELIDQNILESILSLTSNALRRIYAEDQRTQTVAEYRTILENLGEGVGILAADGSFLFANHAAEEIFAVQPESLVGRKISDFLNASSAWESILDSLNPSFHRTGRTDIAVRMDDGRTKILNVSATPQVSNYPSAQTLLCIFHDISARKQIENDLRAVNEELEARVLERTNQLQMTNDDLQQQIEDKKLVEETLRRLETAVNQAAEGIAICDLDNRLQFVNPAWAEMHGFEVTEMLGQAIAVCHTAEQYQKELSPILNILFSTGTINSEVGHMRRDGTLFPTWMTINSIINQDGVVSGYISVTQDITARKITETALKKSREELRNRNDTLQQVNRELARATRAKDEFLANMSHELRTPLTAILGISEALQEQHHAPLALNQLNLIKIIEESGRHLLDMINDILDLSKIEAGKMDLTIEMINLQSLCSSSLQFVKQMANKKKVAVTYEIEPGLHAYQGDQRRLKQILVNLLSNAVKFTHPGGSIGLDVRRDLEKSMIAFEVWDTGIGIEDKDIQRLFQPFTQLDSSLTRQHEGSGLGLALVYRLVDMQGGSIQITSMAGKGSRFSVRLPVQEIVQIPAPPQADETSLPPAFDPQHPPLILLIEDSEVNIHFISQYLESHLFRVIHALNGHEGIQRARETFPDLILMDIHMPGMDGITAIRSIRTEEVISRTPIIALTALTMPGDEERILQAGADLYVSKPFSMQGLVKSIKKILTERSNTRDLSYDRE